MLKRFHSRHYMSTIFFIIFNLNRFKIQTIVFQKISNDHKEIRNSMTPIDNTSIVGIKPFQFCVLNILQVVYFFVFLTKYIIQTSTNFDKWCSYIRFSKILEEKCSKCAFQLFHFKTISEAKLEPQVWKLGFWRFFRHQHRQN